MEISPISPSHPPNEANAFIDWTGSRYDVNMGFEDMVVNGPVEPKSAIVSRSVVDRVELAVILPDTGADEVGVDALKVEKLSN
jgi:hypothetical protein